MRRRITRAVAALSLVCLLVGLTGIAGAAAKSNPKTKSSGGTAYHCVVATSIMVPAGSDAVLPPATQGSEFGMAKCGSALGTGVQRDTFTVPESGNTDAKFALYFPTGTLRGTYVLVPQENSLNFLAASWKGTLKVLGGTGTLKGATGTGTMTCSSPDQVHTACKDTLKLKLG